MPNPTSALVKIPLYLQQKIPDPTQESKDAYILSIRIMRSTQAVLQTVCAAEGVTFWGQAAGIILDYLAHHPEQAERKDLDDCPNSLHRSRTGGSGARRYPKTPLAGQVNAVLSPYAVDWLLEGQNGLFLPTATLQASLILYRNASRAAPLVRAARHAARMES